MQDVPRVSANFSSSPCAMEWLNAISESNAVLSAILSVIHPSLYDAGWETINLLRHTAGTGPEDVFLRWASTFSGISVISNRKTIPHCDKYSRYNWYDMLATAGNYRGCNLELPGLGISLEYGPGMVVGISGMLLEHAVPCFEGDRVCYAYFMRNNVHEWARVPASEWMCTRYYE